MTEIEKRAEGLRKNGATVKILTRRDGGQSLLVTYAADPEKAATNIFKEGDRVCSSTWR